MKSDWLKGKILLILIVLLAGALRFYALGTNPPSLTWDEVAWGYNAYSLGIDGKDEFGKFLPLTYLESFGDFKPPVYAYLDILPIKFLGLNEFAVRFPSALFGTLTVLVTYYLVKRIFGTGKEKGNFTELVALLSALFLAISPWHINLSRAAFEANVATFFIVSGVWLFLGGVAEKTWYLYLSALTFALSIYTFNTPRIVSPLLVLLLVISFRKVLWEKKKETLIAAIIGILLTAPAIPFLLSPQASLRFKEVNIFSDAEIVKEANQYIANDGNAWWSKIIHNRRILYGREYLKHYFDNLSPSFLFIKGDGNPKFSTQDIGQMYIWDIPFFVAGIIFLFRKKIGSWWLIPLWLLLGIIPAATARETPHALRIETSLPTFQIISAFGFAVFACWVSGLKRLRKIRVPLLLAVGSLLMLNFAYYIHGYYFHYPREFSGVWQYGYKETIAYTESVKDDYDEIRGTAQLGRPYVYYLFYSKESPEYFRKTAIVRRDAFGFVHVDGYGKYRFVDNAKKEDKDRRKILYVSAAADVPEGAKVVKVFKTLNGEPVLEAYLQ